MRFNVVGLVFLTLICVSTSAWAQFVVPIYSGDPVRRARQMGVASENLRLAGDEWERFWHLDSPGASPYGSGAGPYSPFPRDPGRGTTGVVMRRTPGGSGVISRSVVRHPPARVRVYERGKPQTPKSEAEQMLEMFARAERAEADGKPNVAVIYFRVVANNAEGSLAEVAARRLEELTLSPDERAIVKH